MTFLVALRFFRHDTLRLPAVAADVGRDCHKAVSVTVDMGSMLDLPAHKVNQIRDIAIQLVRNAVVHGVEDSAQRSALGKNVTGQLTVKLTREETGEWQLSVRDDGAGLDARRIRQKLVDLSWYTTEQLESFSDKQIISHIFKPGFSTSTALGQHAGRGVGLDVVRSHVQSMGARLLLSTVPNQYTDFKVRFT